MYEHGAGGGEFEAECFAPARVPRPKPSGWIALLIAVAKHVTRATPGSVCLGSQFGSTVYCGMEGWSRRLMAHPQWGSRGRFLVFCLLYPYGSVQDLSLWDGVVCWAGVWLYFR